MCQNVTRSLIPGIGTGPQKTSGSAPVQIGVVVRALPLVIRNSTEHLMAFWMDLHVRLTL